MKLPNCDQAVIPEAKITKYLLSLTHRDGRHKAAFFRSIGFALDNWQACAVALVNHAKAHDVAQTEYSPFGTRYIIEGIIQSPDGRNPMIRSIWFIDMGATHPRFVTAYPTTRRDDD